MNEENRPELVQIKGIKEGLLVTLGDGSWPDLEELLVNKIEEKKAFFQGARMALDVGEHELKAADIGILRDKLSERGVALWAIVSTSPVTKEVSKTFGLITSVTNPRVEIINETALHFDTTLSGEKAIMIPKTMRSGFQVAFPGHVVVIGDVNPGAEIIASGSIVVWGWLRGNVHAGAEGNDKSIICALRMDPLQLRIASIVSDHPERKGKPRPEMAHIINNKIMTDEWIEKEGGR